MKKHKRREKEVNSDSERKRVKKRAELQRIFNKIVTKKVNNSEEKSVKNVTSPKGGYQSV